MCDPDRDLRGVCFRGLKFSDALMSNLISMQAASLVKVDLAECDHSVTDLVANELSACPMLVELHLDGCMRISEGVLLSVVSCCRWLVVLALSGCNVTDDVLAALVSPNRRHVHTLLLGGCQGISSKGIESLCVARDLHVLKLSQSDCVTADAALRLASSLRSLRVLDISKCPNMPKGDLSTGGEVSPLEMLTRQLWELLPSTLISV